MISNILEFKNLLNSFNKEDSKIDISLTSDAIDLESGIFSDDIIFEKNIANKYLKENYYSYKIFNNRINQIEFDKLSKFNNNSSIFTSNENTLFGLDKRFLPINETDKNNIFINNKQKIFEIVKVNKKIGRIKKNSLLKGKHNMLSEDNIIRKIKRRFIEKLRLYINIKYKNFLFEKNLKKKKIINWLKKVDPKVSKKIKKEENLKWFKSKIYEIFSENISLRYSGYPTDINKKKINRLFSLNEAKNLINILNSNIESFFDIYINNEEIEGFLTLKDDIIELKVHMENSQQENIDDYLRRYENIAKNMKKIFYNKHSRNPNLKKVNV